MSDNTHVQRVAVELAGLGREELKPRLLDFPSRTRLDFTPKFLDTLTTEQLRHLLLAAIVCLAGS